MEHLGYVQIDTINVIERCHHHILYSRIPAYRRADLRQAQSIDKSVFEYWTHALSYVPAKDFRFFIPAMRQHQREGHRWFASVKPADTRKVMRLLRRDGALTIRDIEDDVLTEKEHLWQSRKPSKRALQLAFYTGEVTISERTGMLKTYELMTRHFGWDKPPKPALVGGDHRLSARPRVALAGARQPGFDLPSRRAEQGCGAAPDRGARAPQGTGAGRARRRRQAGALGAAGSAGGERRREARAMPAWCTSSRRSIRLIIQRKRTELFFGYGHRFEAYVPKEKRLFGYFALPVLVGEDIVAAIDLKTDRQNKKLLMQKWSWVGKGAGAGRAQGLQAPHRGRAGSLRAVSAGGVGRPFGNPAPFRRRRSHRNELLQLSQAAARPACHSASTSWRAMPRVMNTMRERRSASGHSGSATGGWKTWWTPWITTGVCSPRRLRMPLTRSRSSPRTLRRYASQCETAIQSSGSSNASRSW